MKRGREKYVERERERERERVKESKRLLPYWTTGRNMEKKRERDVEALKGTWDVSRAYREREKKSCAVVSCAV